MDSQGQAPRRATEDARSIWKAGVAAVNGRQRVAEFVRARRSGICFGDHVIPLPAAKRICIAAAGKAAVAMTAGLLEQLAGSPFDRSGLVFGQANIPCDALQNADTRKLFGQFAVQACEVRPPHLNLPTPAAVEATRTMRRMLDHLDPDDLCVVLLSGGGSALLAEPRPPLTLKDKIAATNFLFSRNADIFDVNCVRGVLSSVKQGSLIRNCPARHIVTLVISDIIGDPVHLIAGGPTVPDSVDPVAALAIARRYDPDETLLPEAVWSILRAARQGNLLSDGPGLPRAGQRLFVLANNQQAVNAAALRATELGYRFKSWTVAKSRNADGEGRDLYLMLAKCRAGNVCLVCGGEPTVLLAPPEIRGNGGRNQQLILSALQTARNSPPVPGDWCLLSAGTDGQDGVSAAAGAWIDPAVISRVTALGLDGARALAVNDAGSFFDRAGALFFCDATGTNVCDLRVAIRRNG